MHQNSHLLIQILVIFGAAVVMVPLFKKLGLGSIIGYLAGGLLIGPSVFNFVNDTNAISYIGEFGVVFLLFIIGIEMKPARLWTMRRLILGLGGAQIITSAIFLGGAAWMMGVTQEAAIIIGLGLALSSTAMGLQLMTDRNELNSVAGRTGFAILLMQDLAVPMLLALVSVLAGGEPLFLAISFLALLRGWAFS